MQKKQKLLLSSLLLLMAVFFFLFALLRLLYVYDNKYTAGAPYGNHGVFAFSESDLAEPLPLVDGWELYPDRLYTPEDFRSGNVDPPHYTFLGEYPNFSFFEKDHSPFGTATYRLKLAYSSGTRSVVLMVPEVFTTYTLWIDGNPVAQGSGNKTIAFPVSSHTELVFAVENHTHYYSGLTFPPVLGEASVISHMLLIQNMFYGVLFLLPCVLCLFAVVTLFTKSYSLRFAHFGLLCFFFALQTSYHFVHGLGISGVFWYALEDTARMAVLYETIALCTLECDLQRTLWYRKLVRPLCIGFCGFTAVMVVFIIPFAGGIINPYGAIVDFYRILCFLYLLGCALYATLHEHAGSSFVVAACAATGVSLTMNILQNNRFEPLYLGWQTEYTSLLLVVIFWVLMVQHVRSLVETNRQLTGDLNAMVERRTEELHAVLEERKSFFSNLAHDMKAPISSIHGFVNLILRGNLYVDSDLREYLELIGTQTDELGRRVEALTDLHTFDKIVDSPECLEVNALLAQVYHNIEPDTCAAGILLQIVGTPDPILLFGVRKKLLILFENLIYNSLSFTPEDGTITITATTEEKCVLLAVSDTGSGIASEHLPHIFDRFYSARACDGEGSGLGLYIAKLTVEEMGGSITVQSVLGEGTTFFIRLPQAQKPTVHPKNAAVL